MVARGDVLRRALGAPGAAEERWVFAAFVVAAVVSAVTAYWCMQSKMR